MALATVVAADHTGDPTLLNCLKEPYDWLNKHAAEAGPHLLRLKQLPLFLNIDLRTDAWRFKSASALVVGLLYDEENLFRVRDWLLPYKDLVLAAGASPIAQVEFRQALASASSMPGSNRVAFFNDMRRQAEFVDFRFIASETGTVFHAHRLILAAASTHMRERFASGWSDAAEETLDESDFCIESVLCASYAKQVVVPADVATAFLYTGRMERPTLQTNEDAGTMLRELLDLLKLADMWHLEGLKDDVASVIAGELKLVSPSTVEESKSQKSIPCFCSN